MLGQILENKPTLFSATACVVVAILAIPVIIPHMLHGYHMAHITLHIAGLTLAAFLTTLAVASHRRTGSRRAHDKRPGVHLLYRLGGGAADRYGVAVPD